MRRGLLLVLALAATFPTRPQAGARFAVVVGNNLGASGRPRLWFAESDADRLARTLVELGDFAEDRVVLLRGAGARALREALAGAEAKVQLARTAGERPLLVFFYSGHAGAGGLELGGETVSFGELRSAMASSEAETRVAIVDACEAGLLTQVKGATAAPALDFAVSASEGARGLALIASTAVGEQAQESAAILAAEWDHTCAIVGAGVQCWGSNAAGQLGDGSGGGFSAAPVPASGLSGIDSIGAGRAHTCAATGSSNETSVDDALRCWGAAPGTAFGLGNPQTTPAIPMKSGSQSVIRFAVAEVAAGRTHTCVRRVGEDLQCFGPENGSGQLGGTPTGVTEAVAVTGSAGALGIASGADHVCARFPDAATTALLLKCWGSNASGQLGDGTTVTPSTGITVPVSGR